MRLPFTKMQGAGNDFVVLDATRAPLELTLEQVRRLGDRRFGVGADQILVVENSHTPDVDFRYRIYNGFSGDEVEHCGNGARCFVRYVRDKGLTDKTTVRVETVNNLLELQAHDDGGVTVNMNRPVFELERVPFEPSGLTAREVNGFSLWPLDLDGRVVEAAVLSMGNPHAVLRVQELATAPVDTLGPRLERHERFPQRVNVGFMQVQSRREIALRVYERGAGETLACGTGACAAVVAGVRAGWLDGEGAAVLVHTRGGELTIAWDGLRDPQAAVFMTGPAETSFEGVIDL
jgi:diaminopimelate epimerase